MTTGKFRRFAGEVTIKVDEETLNLNKITVKDVQRIVDLSKTKENEIVNGVAVISDIVQKAYPEEPRDDIEAFVLKNYTTLTEELIIALGWTTRDKLELEKKKLVEEKKNN